MKLKHAFAALLLSAFSISGAQAAGSPMNEDFSEIVTLSQKAIATAKTGTVEAFAADADAAYKASKEKLTRANSPAMQRITGKLKIGANQAKDGKVAEGTAAIEEAIKIMNEPRKEQKFGGGS